MFRFTIRELVLVTVIAALAVAWWIDRDRVWKNAEHHRQLVDGIKSYGVDPERILSLIKNNPSAISIEMTIKRNAGRGITSVKVPQSNPSPVRFHSNSDYQAPPRPPLRISDEERR